MNIATLLFRRSLYPILILQFSFLYFLASTDLFSAEETTYTLALKKYPSKSIHGIKFDGATVIDGKIIPLRNAGQLHWWGFNLYAAALYISEDARTISDILGDTPKKLTIHYFRTIKKEQIIEAADKILRKNPDYNMSKIKKELGLMNSWYQTVNKGDRYSLIYEPGKGTSLVFNNVKKGTIPGVAFAKAYFGIWLSSHCGDIQLRNQLITKIK